MAWRRKIFFLGSPRGVHYVALVFAFVTLLFIGRNQWFFGDDWAILVPRLDDDVLVPHVGHWNLIPAVVFPLMREWIGLSNHLPYLALAVGAHLAVAHLVWRILNRVGVVDWLATLLSVLVMVFGGGAENIFWAFQFGFMGAVALGLGVVLLLDRERMNVPAVMALSVLAPMFSGTAIPLLAAGAIVGWVRHGFTRTLLVFLPSALCYLTWYVTFARGPSPFPTGISDLSGVRHAVTYATAMYSAGFGRGLPWLPFGAIPALAAAIWFFATIRRGLTTQKTMAYALILGSLAFVGLTTYSRMALGIPSAIVGRYAYVTLVLLLPALGILLTAVVRRARILTFATACTVVAVVAFNGFLLVTDAGIQAAREAESRARIERALGAVAADPRSARTDLSPADAEWSPDLTSSDLVELYERKQLVP